MNDATKNSLLSSLPSIDELLNRPSLAAVVASQPRARVVQALRRAVADARSRLLAGSEQGFTDSDVASALKQLSAPRLRKVINATGVVLHTNLGRAPLSRRAIERVTDIAAGYSNLELDLEDGERGSRYAPVLELLRELTGAEDALVVNNCAAAVLLTLSALSAGREAIVSRGELVEIGGGFRVPDVMRQSGAQLVEVGTTNRTRLSDYAQAVSDRTGVLVKVHRSNFAVVGFTEEATTAELAGLARSKGLPLFEDLGSGAFVPLAHGAEPTVADAVRAGANVVSFSGDKLLGGPQAGIVVGDTKYLAMLRRHPLNRALRVDKLTIAALEATLELYRDECLDELPVVRMLSQPESELRQHAERLQALLTKEGIDARVVTSEGQVGGGAMPLTSLPGFACSVAGRSVHAVHAKLRLADPPVIGRIRDDALILDVRCVAEEELWGLAVSVGWATRD